MFSPVESQVIFLSKETPIVSVGLRTAELSYTNQNKTAWKSESLYTDGKWSTQQVYEFGFSRSFVLVRVW
jgi:hypothetical protein